jgi:hypothetical protein
MNRRKFLTRALATVAPVAVVVPVVAKTKTTEPIKKTITIDIPSCEVGDVVIEEDEGRKSLNYLFYKVYEDGKLVGIFTVFKTYQNMVNSCYLDSSFYGYSNGCPFSEVENFLNRGLSQFELLEVVKRLLGKIKMRWQFGKSSDEIHSILRDLIEKKQEITMQITQLAKS